MTDRLVAFLAGQYIPTAWWQKAETDPQFATALALLKVADAIENSGDRMAEAIDGLRDSLRSDHPLQGQTLDGIENALHAIADSAKTMANEL